MSNFDSTGTSPGLVGPHTQEPKIQHMRCKQDRCPSLQVIELTPNVSLENSGVPHYRTYQCTLCKCTWSTSVGGFVSF